MSRAKQLSSLLLMLAACNPAGPDPAGLTWQGEVAADAGAEDGGTDEDGPGGDGRHGKFRAATLTPATRTGVLRAAVTVDPMGQAAVSLPLALPDVGNGLAPQLALSYHSGNEASGALGYGWSLGPTSSVRRCPPSLAVDGHDGGLTMTSEDRLCLDGQRLIAVDGKDLADGSSYRLERDDLTLVRYARPAGDAGTFTVYRKSGEILRLGGSPLSRVTHPSGEALEWRVDELRDRSGNFVTFRYAHDEADREVRLTAIDYGGNAPGGVAPYRSVSFTYAPAVNTTTTWVAGMAQTRSQRLDAVELLGDEALLWRYQLGYQTLPAGTGEVLSWVQQCVADGTCSPATRFEYGGGTLAFAAERRAGATYRPADADLRTSTLRRLVDVDNDGHDDIVTLNRAEVVIERSAGTGYAAPDARPSGLPITWSSRSNPALFYDLDGDGNVDILTSVTRALDGTVTSAQTGLYALYGQGDRFAPAVQVSTAFGAGTDARRLYLQLADADRDGRPELFAFTENGVRVLSRKDGAYVDAMPLLPEFGLAQGWRFDRHPREVADVNGDGFPDLVGFGASAVMVSLGHGFAFDAPTAWTTDFTGTAGELSFGIENHLRLLVDASGDGLPDLVGFHRSGVYVGVNTGRGFAPIAMWLDDFGTAQGWTSASQLRTATDVNGDGLCDFVGISPSNVRVVLGRGGPLPKVATLPPDQVRDTGTATAGFKQWKRSLYPLDLADVNSDGLPDLAAFLPDGVFTMENQGAPLRLTTVTDGYGQRTRLTFGSGADPAVYRRTRALPYPLSTLPALGLVVTALTEDGDGAPARTLTYRYANAVVHRAGLGFLGVETWTTTDAQAASERVVTLGLDVTAGNAGLPVRDETFRLTGATRVPSSTTTTTWATRALPGSPAHRFTWAASTTTVQRDDDGAELARTVVSHDYDAELRLTTSATRVTDTFGTQTVTTTHAYGQDDLTRWLVGRPTRTTVRFERDGQPAVINTSSLVYDELGRLAVETRSPDTAQALRTEHDRSNNPFGLVGATTRVFSARESGGLPATRATSTVRYDARGFVASTTNPLGHTAQVLEREEATLQVLAVRDEAGIVTRFVYGADGALLETQYADGTRSTTEQVRCDATCPPGAVLRTTTNTTGAAPEVSYTDGAGRVVRVESRGLGGRVVRIDRAYAHDGQVTRESLPFFADDPAGPRWTVRTYDAQRRLVSITRPDGKVERIERQGATTTTIDALGRRTSDTVDASGQVRVRVDASGATVRHDYDAAGRLIAVIDPLGHRTETTYDSLGRKVRVDDPSLGTTTTTYNALGLPVEVRDQAGHVTRHRYDLLGRVLEQRAHAGEPDEDVSTYTYDATATSIGKMASIANGEVARAYAYDALGRPSTTTVTIGGASYQFKQAYDAAGRAGTMTYPSGLAITPVYDESGVLRAVKNAATGQTYAVVESTYAWGAPERVRLGNGLVTTLATDPASLHLVGTRTTRADGTDVIAQRYAYDEAGNLLDRDDPVTGVHEAFTYDALDRLTGVYKDGATPVTVRYDALGNLLERSDVGTYAYGEACDGVAPGPFAVTRAGGRRYCYDAKGQLLSGAGRTLAWGAADRPVRIASETSELAFTYGPLGERVTQVEHTAGHTTRIVYVGPGYEEVQRDGVRERRHTLAEGVLVVEREGETHVRYQHVDALGSPLALTDANGAVVERFTYDPWGQRQRLGDAAPDSLRYGFTGQEQLESVGLVHMGGRVYDPAIGRFVSADPFVEDAADAQALNRYSYVRNNPLGATDPSGFLSMKSIGRSIGKALGGLSKGLRNPGKALSGAGQRLSKWVSNPQNQRMVAAIAISVAVAIAAPAAAACFEGWAQWAVGSAIAGAGGWVSGYVASDGNLDYARRSALTSMAFFAIGQYYMGQELTTSQMVTKAVAHGVVGGVSSVANGGSFESGFATNLVSEAISLGKGYDEVAGALSIDPASAAYSAASAAIVGGATSSLTGGTFESGAISAALGSLYNSTFHRILQKSNGDVILQKVHHADGADPNEPCTLKYETILRETLLQEGGIVYDPTLELVVGAAYGAFALRGVFVGQAAVGAEGFATNVANGPRLARQLAESEARAMFTTTGELTPEAIQGASKIIDGGKLGNQALVRELTSNGSNIAEWGKYTTATFRTPAGPAQAHFYYNSSRGVASYTMDFKVVFNHQGAW